MLDFITFYIVDPLTDKDDEDEYNEEDVEDENDEMDYVSLIMYIDFIPQVHCMESGSGTLIHNILVWIQEAKY